MQLYESYCVENVGLTSAFFGVDLPRPKNALFTRRSLIPRCSEKYPLLGVSSLNVTGKYKGDN